MGAGATSARVRAGVSGRERTHRRQAGKGTRSAGGQAAARAAGAGRAQAWARGARGARGARRAARGVRGVGVPVQADWACWLVS